MSSIQLRKTVVYVEDIHHEGGPPLPAPLVVATVAAVIRNPYAGRYEPDLLPFMAELRALGASLAQSLIAAIGGALRIEAYGKGAIVGEDGELEHGALWHEAGGWSLRAALGEPKAIVPAAKTVATLGTRLMVPMGHTHAAFVRGHLSVASLSVWDAPRRNEIVFGLCAATGPRVHSRLGGLEPGGITVHDGQR